MGAVIPYADAVATFDRDRSAYELKIRGHTERQIAEQLRCSVEQVRSGIARMQGDIPPDYRRAAVMLDLDRIEAMWQAHFERACAGEPISTRLCLEMMERKAKLIGADAPPTGTDIFAQALVDARTRSTARIRNIFDGVVKKEPSHDAGPASGGDQAGA